MPPLYRMPIFYLGLLAVGGVVGLARLIGGETQAPIGQDGAAPSAAGGPAALAPIAEPPIDRSSQDGILRTPEGLRRKALVTTLGLRPRQEPEDEAPASDQPLDYYSIQFVHDVAEPEGPDGPRWLQVGPAEGPPTGWVLEESVLEWATRLMARPTPRASRPPLVIFRERSCLFDNLANRDCPKHEGPCPIEGEEPEFSTREAPSDAEGRHAPVLGLPILSSRSIPQPEGTELTVFEVASLVADRAPPPPPPAEPPEHLKRLLRRVYLAFVIDTTASMQSYIDAARKLASNLAADANREGVTLRLALVVFRDDHPTFHQKVRIVTPFVGADNFRQTLDRIQAASRGDGSVAEAVLDGVAAALPAPEGEHLGEARHLNWPTGREGNLATKLLVLIGDAPDHDRDLIRANALASLAKTHRITIAAVSIERQDLRGDEPERYQAQWGTLASGSFRPRDPDTGFSLPIAPVRPTLSDASNLGPTLQALFSDRVQAARELAALLEAEAEGRLQDYVNQRGLTLDRIAPVLVDLHRDEPQPQPRPDPRLDGQRAPSVRRGWIAERVEGVPLVTVEMLMTRAELAALIEELSQFQQALHGGASDLTDLLRIGTAAATGESSFLSSDRGETTFAAHLRRRQGLPPAPPDSLLHRSQTELLQADTPYRATVSDRLASAIAQLLRRLNAPDWDDPNQTTSGMALVPYTPIDF